MRSAVALAVALLLIPGCLDSLQRGFEDHDVARSPLDPAGWNRDGVFTVQVREAEPVSVLIRGTATDGRTIEASGPSSASLPPVELVVPDGTWTLRYELDGVKWETFKDVRFDATPPSLAGLQTLGEAVNGAYDIGVGASVEAGADVRVVDQATGAVVGLALPARVTGLADGIHTYDVIATDEAGNEASEQVQVRAGAATLLPPGQHTLGLVARYEVDALVWDLTDLGGWTSPAAARAAVGGAWLGDGRAIVGYQSSGADADDRAATQAVVDLVVTDAMSTGEVALELFRWMSDHLEYDQGRLESSTLLTPHQTLLDGEDPRDDTAAGEGDEDGLARDGGGNGVFGGVCRDLAATYVSLLRVAGVPARLVTGYLGGEVNGFHAWVEFYGGPGHGPSPWVPVDISSVGSSAEPGEQGYEPEVALQAFGLRHTGMLPLRVVTAEQEQGGWSAAVRIATRYPEGSPPDIDLAKELPPAYNVESKGTMCIDRETLARQVIASRDVDDCPRGTSAGFPDFTRSATHVLDYGAVVRSAAAGTTVTLSLAYPDPAAVAPGGLEQATYGDVFERDEALGVTVAEWKPGD